MAYNPINNTFTTLSDLSQQAGTPDTIVQVLGGTSFNDGNGGPYFWDSTSTATPDGMLIVQVTGVNPGRWMRSKNNNYGTQQVTFSGIALTTTYTANHGQSFIPKQIHLQPRSQSAASGVAYVANITATTFQIIFTAVPLLGTNNITFDIFPVRNNS